MHLESGYMYTEMNDLSKFLRFNTLSELNKVFRKRNESINNSVCILITFTEAQTYFVLQQKNSKRLFSRVKIEIVISHFIIS